MTINLDTKPVSATYPAISHKDLSAAHRLVVLLPANTDFSAATQRVGALARSTGMHIQLLGLCEEAAEAPRLRRELITMASLLQGERICAEANVEVGTNWIELVKANYADGDMLVCLPEERPGLFRKPLSQIVESNFKATVYVLSDLAPQKPRAHRLLRMSMWLGVIAVIAGFGILQTKIVQVAAGGLQNLLLLLSLIPEFGLIWVWDSWFR
jgi:hypothetical protein